MKHKLLILLFSLILFVPQILLGQTITTDAFPSDAQGATSFTSNGQIFNITTQAQGPFTIDQAYPGTGWSGTAADNGYIDNDNHTTAGIGVGFTISSSGSVPFHINSFWLFLSDNTLNQSVSGSVTVVGKLAGVTKFTVTSSSGFNSNSGVDNGFSLIDFTVFGGSNNTTASIDQLVITSAANFDYVGLDAFKWTSIATLSSTTSQTNASCNGSCNGTATVVASGGTSPYTYSWSPSGGTGATASSLCAGSYTCTITDHGGVIITKAFTITQPSALASSISSKQMYFVTGPRQVQPPLALLAELHLIPIPGALRGEQQL